MHKRPSKFYINYEVCKEVKDVEAIYSFASFILTMRYVKCAVTAKSISIDGVLY